MPSQRLQELEVRIRYGRSGEQSEPSLASIKQQSSADFTETGEKWGAAMSRNVPGCLEAQWA